MPGYPLGLQPNPQYDAAPQHIPPSGTRALPLHRPYMSKPKPSQRSTTRPLLGETWSTTWGWTDHGGDFRCPDLGVLTLVSDMSGDAATVVHGRRGTEWWELYKREGGSPLDLGIAERILGLESCFGLILLINR